MTNMNKSMENLTIASHEIISGINSSLPNTSNTVNNETNRDSPQEASSGGENDQGSLNVKSNSSPKSKKENKENKSCKDNKNQKEQSMKNGVDSNNQESIRRVSSSLELRKHSTQGKKEGKSRSRKKKSWYSNILYPTYKSRSDNFKKIFKDVPDEERLVVDYSCALQREILVHGRLYVSQNYLCFYANIFMWETLVSMRWKDVTSITKEKTALVIPNAISIHTANDKFFFTSFGSRDKTFMMLFKVWQNALLSKSMDVSELWQLVHESYGKELGLTSEDDDYVAPLSLVSNTEKTPTKHSSFDSIPEKINKMENLVSSDGLLESTLTESSPVHSATNVTPDDITDISGSSDSEKEKDSIVSKAVCTSAHDGRLMIKATIPVNLDHLFTLLFTASKFFLDFHTARKSTDLVQSAWTQDIATGHKVRKVSLIVSLNKTVGPKTSQVTETQIMLPCSTPGQLYCIDVETTNAGIPYADSFSVLSHYCMSSISKHESSLVVYTEIKYKKSVWGLVKTLIDKNCWSGVQEYLNSLVKALTIECEENVEIIKRPNRKSRKRRITSGGTIQTHSPDHTAFNHQPPASELTTSSIMRVPDIHKEDNSTLSWIIIIAIISLIIINCLLYYKLSSIEEANSYTKLDLHVLKNVPKTEEDWMMLLQQQERLHNVEVKKWQRILDAALKLLKQTEESLTQLQMSIHPSATEKVISVLRPGIKIPNSQNDQQRNSEL